MSFDAALLDDPSVLRPGNAVAALLVLADGRLVLQLRDAIPGIFFPDHWGLFGGATEPGEDDATALIRELDEELGIEVAPGDLDYFTRFDFGMGFGGLPPIYRTFFTVRLGLRSVDGLVIREGAAVRAFTPREVASLPNVTPYDGFALWLYTNQHRLVA